MNFLLEKPKFWASVYLERFVEKRWLKNRPATHHAASLFSGGREPGSSIETYFITSDSRRIPVFSSYRYSVKPGWLSFEPLRIFHALNRAGRLEGDLDRSKALDFLGRGRGTRTVGVSTPEMETLARELAQRHSDFFVSGSLEKGQTAAVRPSRNEIESQVLYQERMFQRLFSRLDSLGVAVPKPGAKVLEIGFVSGGHSLFALERLGFRPHGVDNDYGGILNSTPLPKYLKETLSSSVGFHRGDITAKTEFADGSFDMIYSASVLEHIQDIPGALREMHRLLKPGGIALHSYNPFFCPGGGHALGTLDCPWGHVRISHQDYRRYIDELRPLEASMAHPWIDGALSRKYPIGKMQEAFLSSDLKLEYWEELPTDPRSLMLMNKEVTRDAFEVNPGISLSDLMTQNVIVAARKV